MNYLQGNSEFEKYINAYFKHNAQPNRAALEGVRDLLDSKIEGIRSNTVRLIGLTEENTPGYPVGVFTPETFTFLGEATGPDQVVALWNANAECLKYGEIRITTNPLEFKVRKTDLILCGVIGLRFFKYDVPYMRIDTISVPDGSIVDFGNGVWEKFYGKRTYNTIPGMYNKNGYQKPTSLWIYSDGAYDMSIPISKEIMGTYHSFGYNYPVAPSDASPYTVTVYHSEGAYYFYNDNNYGSPYSNASIRNIRGNLPKGLYWYQTTHCQQATFNTFANITNFNEFKDAILHFNPRGYVANLNFDLTASRNLISLDYGASWGATNQLKTVLGTTNLPEDFKHLKYLTINEAQYTADLNLGLKNFQRFTVSASGFTGSVITSAVNDSFLIALNDAKQDTGGIIRLRGTRTAASDTAYNALVSKGVSVIFA